METITFYSYKGGVGRTLALANVAIYLSRFGLNACLMDFDLESPGLHYKFPQFLETTDIKAGLVDYIYEFACTKIPPKSLNEFSIEILPSSESQGGILLIPAGNVLSLDYWQKLASINWNSLFYEEDSEGIPFFLELKERIRKEFDPDFLLIDSRTGIAEMSGLCTSLLPDKVVFLIANNQENVEGARQILRSIQKVERLPEQKPIDVTFALARIPEVQETREHEKTEDQIVKDIQDSLNEPTDDLEHQLNVDDIYILHSDRELELRESLRLSQEEIRKERLLMRDYLRLFSKIISDEVTSPRLDNILDNITTTAKLFEDPDRVQRELTELVFIYRQPKCLERLIDLYIVRNESRKIILNAFHYLWNHSGIDNPSMLSKYVSFFMKWAPNSLAGPRFELEIIEKFLTCSPTNRIEIEMRLAEAYREYKEPEKALEHYFQLVHDVKDKKEIIREALDICIAGGFYDYAMKLLENYSDIIHDDLSLRMKMAEVLHTIGKEVEALQMLYSGDITDEYLLSKEPCPYFKVMETLGMGDEAEKYLNAMLEDALSTMTDEDYEQLLKVGEIFYKLDRKDEFRDRIESYSVVDEVVNRLEVLMEADDDIPF